MFKFTFFSCRCFPSPIKRSSLLSTFAECMSGAIKKEKRLRLSDLLSFMFPKYPSYNNRAEPMRKADSYFLQVSTDIHPSKLFEPLATPKENQSVGTIYEHLLHLLRTILVHLLFFQSKKNKQNFSCLVPTRIPMLQIGIPLPSIESLGSLRIHSNVLYLSPSIPTIRINHSDPPVSTAIVPPFSAGLLMV